MPAAIGMEVLLTSVRIAPIVPIVSMFWHLWALCESVCEIYGATWSNWARCNLTVDNREKQITCLCICWLLGSTLCVLQYCVICWIQICIAERAYHNCLSLFRNVCFPSELMETRHVQSGVFCLFHDRNLLALLQKKNETNNNKHNSRHRSVFRHLPVEGCFQWV